ncbi:MAG: peptide chain release factor N(5)-glutamine methyltransferase [Rudaea sp.]
MRELLADAQAALSGDDARGEAELLLAHALGVDRAWLIAHRDDAVAPALAGQVRCCVSRRAAGEPVAYIIGHRGFHAIELSLTPDVLIPRPETELLVELALRRIPQSVKVDIADLGTGSGAVALAIAQSRPRARLLATDASAAVLDVARGNAQRLGLGNVEFAHGDWCAALGARRFNMIVSNPPYIAQNDAHLQRGDLRFEPRMALASGADGLDAIRAIVGNAPDRLNADGWLLLEHGFDQGPAVRALLQKSGFVEVFTERDLEGRERVSGGVKPR